MKADLTRDTFRSFKHFRRVLMQQGRVQLDADWNEQAAILLHLVQSLARDIIGEAGGPAGAFAISPVPFTPAVTNDFRIGLGDYYVDGILCEAESNPVYVFQPSVNAAGTNAVVTADRLTLDGTEFQQNQFVELFDGVALTASAAFQPTVVQISNVDPVKRQLTLAGPFNLPTGSPLGTALGNAKNPGLRRVVTYLTQPDYPVPDPLPTGVAYVVYLDVWERHITYIEDDHIREVALGGADTATRSKVIWQVRVAPGTVENANNPCDNFNPSDQNLLPFLFGSGRGRLKAMAQQKSVSTDPCIIPPDANYRGAENQLYRVEIHRPGPAWNGSDNPPSTTAATFKWSRENGSVIFPIVSVASGSGTTTVVLENLGRDDRFGLSEGDWVELVNDVLVLQSGALQDTLPPNTPPNLLQVQAIDSGSLKVTLTGTADPKLGDPATHPLLRRWDHQAGDPAEGGLTLGSDGAALIQESSDGNWLALEDGVQIQFQLPDTGRPVNQYRTGDYWLIPARTATSDVEWPREAAKDSTGATVIAPIAKPPDGIQHHYAPLAIFENGTENETFIPCSKSIATQPGG